MPALYLVMAVCSVLAWLWLLPEEWRDFTQSLLAVSVFASNLLFMRETGYFDDTADAKPLLHTWSLSIEEQFYLLYPFVLWVLWRFGRRWLILFLVATFVISFVFSQWAVSMKPEMAFYLLPARAWELLAGAFVSLCSGRLDAEKIDRGWGEACGWLGVGLILFAALRYDGATPFPGASALVPTVGAMLFIAFVKPRSVIGKIFGCRPLVAIGLVSYGVYLWHHALFAFARERSLLEPAPYVFVSLAVLAVALAGVSWRFLERPILETTSLTRRQVFISAVVGAVLFAGVGMAGHFGRMHGRTTLTDDFLRQFEGHRMRTACDDRRGYEAGEVPFCVFGVETASDPTVALFGDSHSDALNPVFDRLGKTLGFAYAHNGLAGCPPLLGVDMLRGRWRRDLCRTIAERQFRYVQENNVRTVVLVARWSLYTQGEYTKDMAAYFLTEPGSLTASREASRKAFESAFSKTLAAYRSLGVKVVVVLQVPQQTVSARKVYSKLALAGEIGAPEAMGVVHARSVTRADHLVLQQFNRSYLRSLADDGLVIVDPDRALCDAERCDIGSALESFYRDDDHVNSRGALLLEAVLKEALG